MAAFDPAAQRPPEVPRGRHPRQGRRDLRHRGSGMSARSTRGPGGGRVGGRRPPTRGGRTRGSSTQSGCGMTAVVLAPLLPVLVLAALLRHAISLAGPALGGVGRGQPGPQSTRFAGDPSGTAAGRAGSIRRTSPVPPAVTSLTAGGRG